MCNCYVGGMDGDLCNMNINNIPPPANANEQALEIQILTLINEAIEHNMELQDILNVLERCRQLTTEILLEVQEIQKHDGSGAN